MLDISVILTTHNRPKLLKRAISSVVELLRHCKSELIVIDDGDNLESGKLVAEMSLSIGIEITYLKRNDKPGLGRSRNYGVKLSRGRNLVFLDDDDQIVSRYYISLIENSRNFDKLIYGDFYYVLEDRGRGKIFKVQSVSQESKSIEQLEFQNFIPVASYVVPKIIFMDYKWDENIGTHEDYDFMLHVKRNFKMQYHSGGACKIYLDVHRKGQMTSASKIKQGLDNLQIYRKYNTSDEAIEKIRCARLNLYGIGIERYS
jgi:glycosyltransferase involved in cell wall biosynthesis